MLCTSHCLFALLLLHNYAENSRLQKKDVDGVVLVGGSTCIPILTNPHFLLCWPSVPSCA
jgi:molecular chaperone DnaK (HSP70)